MLRSSLGFFASPAAAALTAVVALVLAGAAAAPAAAKKGKGGENAVEISRSKGGIPSITARNWRALGFGYGYAFAEDNLCTIADSYVTVRAQRSRYFGPDERSPEGERNLDSDFFYQRIIDRGTVEELLDRKPPLGPKPAVTKVIRGYVQGYNRYLRRTGVDELPDPRCRGAQWVKPIKEIDAYRRIYELTLYASAGAAIDGIANAQPPGAQGPPNPAAGTSEPSARQLRRLGSALDFTNRNGSNAWGLGSEATRDGGGMVLANPHFPWQGPRRFYQTHLRIPGKLNVSGASLFGAPVVNIGHTRRMAWSHTVSTAYRFTPYQLELDPSDPTAYMVDGESLPMERDEVTVQVKQPNGSLAPKTRTLYATEYGPITTSIQGQSLFGWTEDTAFAMFDANAENARLLNHFLDTNRAQSSRELLEILRKYEGIPWVNTIASDSKGRALYADIGSIPNVPDAKATGCASSFGQLTFPALGLPTLDGSRSECAPEQAPDAAAPGVFGDSQMPHLMRRDYVANGNDSYWLTNPEAPLEGYPRIIGNEGSPRSLRTRLGLLMIQDRLAGRDGLEGDKFTRAQLRRLVFQNRHYAGELWRDQLVDYCEANPIMTGSSGPVDVRAACGALERWDGRVNVRSRGAVLFVRFMDYFGSGSDNFASPYDPSDPVNTPFGLNTAAVELPSALADAVSDLRAAMIPLDAAYGNYHYVLRGDRKIPIHGGGGGQGIFNAISDRWEENGPGYSEIRSGSSFVMATELGGGCPRDRSILTYSLSENPDSPHYSDQTRMFSRKNWINPPFCAKEVRRQSRSSDVIRAPKAG